MRTILLPSSLLLSLLLSFGCGDDSEASSSSSTTSSESETETESPTAMSADPHANIERPAATGEAPTGTPTAGGIRWSAPEPFRRQQPQSQMRAAEYLFPDEGDEGGASTLTVFFFGPGQGGGIQENVDRWVGQFTQPDGSDSSEVAITEQNQVNGMQVTTVSVTGTYAASPMMGGTGAPQENQRMLAAIAEGPQGPVFFKMVGSAALMERAEAPFNELVSTFEAM